jgi:hypothetical protein
VLAGGFSGTSLEEFSSRFDDAHFLRDGRGNPLIQRDAVFGSQTLCRFLDRMREFKGYVALLMI